MQTAPRWRILKQPSKASLDRSPADRGRRDSSHRFNAESGAAMTAVVDPVPIPYIAVVEGISAGRPVFLIELVEGEGSHRRGQNQLQPLPCPCGPRLRGARHPAGRHRRKPVTIRHRD